METVQIIILSIVQGITEFLPISSSGHLVILPKIFHWPEQGMLFDTALHIGTLLAVMIYFRKEALTSISGVFHVLARKKTTEAKLSKLLIISTLPMIVIGICIQGSVEHYARSLLVVGSASIVYGLLLLYADRRPCTPNKALTYKEALIYGLFQVLAAIPGTSRSGICITAGRLMGYSRVEVTRYSMLMAMPLIALIGVWGFVGEFESPFDWQNAWKELLLGVFISFISALAAIHLLMKWVEKVGFLPFVIYRVLLGVLLIYIYVAYY